MTTLLITGAAGNIGKKLRAHLSGRYDLRLIDIDAAGDPKKIIPMDLSKWSSELIESCTGVDALIHLAADPYETKSWSELVAPNLDALNNVFAAAIETRVPRLIFASSNHTMGRYKEEEGDHEQIGWLTTELAPKPGTLVPDNAGTITDSIAYGSMKLFGERLGHSYAQCTGGIFIGVRIGWVNRVGENRKEDLPAHAPLWYKQMWLSTRDLCQLFEHCITTQKEPGSSLLLNGMSNNEGMVWDLEHTRRSVGYEPQDRLTLQEMTPKPLSTYQ